MVDLEQPFDGKGMDDVYFELDNEFLEVREWGRGEGEEKMGEREGGGVCHSSVYEGGVEVVGI
jgi:hypothetical protein